MLSKLSDFAQRKILWESPARALKIYEKIPRRILQWYRHANLIATLRLAANKALFYSKLFDNHPFDFNDVRTPKDLFPIFTEEKDLIAHPPSHFLCGRPDTAFESTGTTSKTPKRIFFSNRELEDAGRIGAAGLWRAGVRPHDKVASSFDYSFWVSGPALKAALSHIGAFHVEAGRIDPADFYDRIKPYECSVIVSDPGWLVRLSEVAERKGPWAMSLMIAGGENLAESSRKYIESVWNAKVLLSYGQTEAFGMIGLECFEQNGYHVNDMDLWAEIPVTDAEGYGELVYTTLRRTIMPLVRYRSGDVTKLIEEPCPCGIDAPRLAKLKGRADEMAVTSVGNIAPWMIQEAIEASGVRFSEWQVRLDHTGRLDRIEFHGETNGELSAAAAREALLSGMKTTMAVAYQGISQGLAQFDVSVLPSGTLRQGRKVKRIVDNRNFNRKR